jgi:3-isopropylmalate dehydrogenase
MALLGLRKGLGLFANLRPAILYPQLVDASSLKPELVSGLDILIVRELTGGIYFGQPRGVSTREDGERVGVNTLIYGESEIRRICKVAFDIARKRNRCVCSVDKANVLESTELWREVATEVGAGFPDVALSHMYVDNAAMQLVRAPKQFDVLVTTNMFGDILSDLASELAGGLGLGGSLNAGADHAMAQAQHGSAPDIAGRGIANPASLIASVAMLFDWLAGRHGPAFARAADAIRENLDAVLADPALRTPDLDGTGTTAGMGRQIAARVKGRAGKDSST